jgi:FkbM family methyltransferase
MTLLGIRQGGGKIPTAVSLLTDVGELWLPADCQVVTPALEAVGTWDAEDGAALASALEPGMTVVDVGAHVGYFAILAARIVGSRGGVVAVEPDPLNFSLLRANVERLGLDWVETVNAAAWSSAGTLDLSRSEVNSGDHRIGDDRADRVTVRAVTVDELIGDARVDVALLDTQGSERAVVEGMTGVIASSRPRLQVEFWPDAIRELGDDPCELIEWYRDLGYEVRVLGEDVGGSADPAAFVASAESAAGGFRTLILS